MIRQQFNESAPHEVLTSNLTYVNTNEGWRYVCFIIDLFNHESVGYSISKHHDTSCVLAALDSMNISDRGGEFRLDELSQYMKDNDIKQSMSKASCPFDNAVSENMFKLLKTEGVDNRYRYPENLVIAVDKWIKRYNIVRVHSKLNYVSPRIYREKARW